MRRAPMIRWSSIVLLCLAAGASVCLFICAGHVAEATRVRNHSSSEEPSSKRVYSNYRYIHLCPENFYLKQAKALNESELAEIYQLRPQPTVANDTQQFATTAVNLAEEQRLNFTFNSTDYLHKSSTTHWYLDVQERMGLHVYDDQRDLERAAGPQVNERLCGLHLDYMLHMLAKHMVNIANSSDFSLFHLMHAFDAPRLGVAIGNTLFPGHYQACRNHKLNIIKEELEEAVGKQAAHQYFESTRITEPKDNAGGTVSALLSLVAHYLGPFVGVHQRDPSCAPLEERAPKPGAPNELRALPMRYCWAGLRWDPWNKSSWARRHLTLRTAACLPETCDSRSLAKQYSKIKQLTDFSLSTYHAGYHIDSLYCLPDEQSDLRQPTRNTSTILFIAFQVIWFALIIGATLSHYLLKSRNSLAPPSTPSAAPTSATVPAWWRILLTWSVIENVRRFFAHTTVNYRARNNLSNNNKSGHSQQQKQQSELSQVFTGGAAIKRANIATTNRLDLAPLEALKVVGSISVIFSHILMVWLGLQWNRYEGHDLFKHTWLVMSLSLCPSSVNFFFLITGLLTVRILLKTSRQYLTKANFWLIFLVYRYARIVPLYLLIHWFLQSTFRFIGSGPLWDYGTSHSAWSYVCQQESIWRVLLPSANFVSPMAHCNGVGWYMANDMQFLLLAPILIPLFYKRPNVAHVITITGSLVAMVNHVRYFYHSDPDPRGLLEWNAMVATRVSDDTMPGYVNPQYRVVPFLIGLSVGRLLDQYDRGEIQQWPKLLTVYGKHFFYLVLYFNCAIPFVSIFFLNWSQEELRPVAALLAGTSHGLSSLAMAIFIILLTTGHFPRLARLMSANLFRLLASMSLSTTLVHIPLVLYQAQATVRPGYLDLHGLFAASTVWIIESFVLAFFVHILYEIPLRRFLVKQLLSLLAMGKQKHHEQQQEPRVANPATQPQRDSNKTTSRKNRSAPQKED